MTLTVEQKEKLIGVIREVLPGAKWAPEEAWLEDTVGEKQARKGSEPVHFRALCRCGDGKENAELTLFLKADLTGQHYNTVSRIQHRVERWAWANLLWSGCGMCSGRLTIDVRLFRVENRGAKPAQQLEEEFDLSF